MMTLVQLRELEPNLKDLPDAEVVRIRQLLYDQAALALECFVETKAKDKIKKPKEEAMS